jgi:hypothetical protein
LGDDIVWSWENLEEDAVVYNDFLGEGTRDYKPHQTGNVTANITLISYWEQM